MCLISIDITWLSCKTHARGFVRGLATLSSYATLHILTSPSQGDNVWIYISLSERQWGPSPIWCLFCLHRMTTKHTSDTSFTVCVSTRPTLRCRISNRALLGTFQTHDATVQEKNTYLDCDLKHLGRFGNWRQCNQLHSTPHQFHRKPRTHP